MCNPDSLQTEILYHSFILRLLRQPTAEAGTDCGRWNIQLSSLQDGSAHKFSHPDELFSFLGMLFDQLAGGIPAEPAK